MSGRLRLSVVTGTWVVSLLLVLLTMVLGSVAPESLEGQENLGWAGFVVGVLAITGQAMALASMGRRVSLTLGWMLVCGVVPFAAAAGLGAATGAAVVAVLVGAYAVVVATASHRCLVVLVVGALLLTLGEITRAARAEDLSLGSGGAAVLQGALTVVVGAVVGSVVRMRREIAAARADQARATTSEQEALARAAVDRQRTSMARELHDIAAHHLSGIAVMTAALDRQIDTDPVGAKVAVRQVRQQSTAMLRDLRNLVALLRDEDARTGALEVEPETLEGVSRLVEQARSAGLQVSLGVCGTADNRLAELDVGPLAQLAAYRTTQEALTNAARHAPGAACDVVIDARDPEVLVVAIRNEASSQALAPSTGGSGGRGGFGLIGMRERAELTDARLETGPTPDGGFSVVLSLPRSGEGAP